MTTHTFDERFDAGNSAFVTDAHFGVIYSTFYSFDAFLAQSAELKATHFRWPGGTRGETGNDIADKDGDGDRSEYLFSLTDDDLFVIEGKGLFDMLSASVEVNAELSIILPSINYLNDLATAEQDAHDFVSKLLLRSAGFGQLPTTIVLELGNETLDGSLTRATEYAAVANAQLTGIRSARNTSESDPSMLSVAVQIGRSAEEDRAIRQGISEENLGSVDGLIAHHLPINIWNHNRELNATSPQDIGVSRLTRSVDFVEAWSRAVAEARNDANVDFDLLISAWTVDTSGTSAGNDLAYQDLGARQGHTTIDTFVQLIGSGADSAHLWGIDARANLNAYSSKAQDGFELIHGRIAFQMMAEALPGMALVGDYTQTFTANGTPIEPGWVYAFESQEKYVLFAVANDLEAAETMQIKVTNADLSRNVEVARLSTLNDSNLSDGTEKRLFEEPKVSSFDFDITSDSFDFQLTNDFEVNRLTIWKEEAAKLPNLDGLAAAESLFGSGARNVVVADRDEWGVGGTTQDDKSLDAPGEHLLSGGGGADVFVFKTGTGANTILDFDVLDLKNRTRADQLDLSAFGYEIVEQAFDRLTETEYGTLFEDQGTEFMLKDVSTLDLTDDHFDIA